MRNSIFFNMITIIVVACSMSACNDDDNGKQDNENPPVSSNCQTPGYINCNGMCIDPLTTDQYCGANAFCEGFKICQNTETCQQGKCVTTSTDPVDPTCPDGNCQGEETKCKTEAGPACEPITTRHSSTSSNVAVSIPQPLQAERPYRLSILSGMTNLQIG